jgi:hypothetical protein
MNHGEEFTAGAEPRTKASTFAASNDGGDASSAWEIPGEEDDY